MPTSTELMRLAFTVYEDSAINSGPHLRYHQHVVSHLGILQLVGDQDHNAVLQQTTEAVFKQETSNGSVHRTERIIQEVDVGLAVDSPGKREHYYT